MSAQNFVYRNPAILAHASGQACANCGCKDGSVAAAHSNLQEHGRGAHHKAHDFFVAFLCQGCRAWLDAVVSIADPSGYFDSDYAGKRDMFRRAMTKTQLVLLRDGVLR